MEEPEGLRRSQRSRRPVNFFSPPSQRRNKEAPTRRRREDPDVQQVNDVQAPEVQVQAAEDVIQIEPEGEEVGTQVPTQQPLLDLHDLPTLEEAFNHHIPTHKYPAKGARAEYGRECASIWGRMAEFPDNKQLWVLYFIFQRVILPAGRGPRQADAYSQARLQKERLSRWRKGEVLQLWEEAKKLTKIPTSKKKRQRDEKKEKTQEEKNAARASTLAADGQLTRAVQALTSHGLAEHNRATEAEMRDKHPPASQPMPPPPITEAQPLSFDQQTVKKGVQSFKRGSAPGPSGWRPEHLKTALTSAPGRRDKALENLTRLVNSMLKGEVPEEVTPFLCGGRLHAAIKKDGGLRPIAVGDVGRRLVGKLAAAALADRAAALLSPHQLGVGVRGACEAIHQALREALDKNPDKAVLQLDLINAFNTVDRATAIQELANNFPEALPWVTSCYGSPSHLLFGPSTILSESGLHQGDPLAPLLFALVLQPIVEMLQGVGLDLNAWYLDDGTLVGGQEELQAALDIMLKEGPPKGLILSTAATSRTPKSTLWQEEGLEVRLRNIPTVQEPGIIVLGAPVGSEPFIREALEAKVEKIKTITKLLPNLEDPHLEFVLLRSTLSLPKIAFFLRSVNTSPFTDLLESFDRITREALNRIIGCPVNNQQWNQAKLPVHLGGLGLRAATDHAAAAHVASLLASETLVRQLVGAQENATFTLPQRLLDTLTIKQGEEATVETIWGLNQRNLSKKIDSNNLLLLSNQLEGDVRESARLKSLGLPYAGAWLVSPPIPALGLHLKPVEFCTAVKLRLGCAVYDSDAPCPACQRPSDKQGDHALCCNSWGERISRHNWLRDHIFAMAASAFLNPVKEGRFLLPGADRRPADVLIPFWEGGQDAALDVTVVHPLQAAFVAEASNTAGHALDKAFDRKMTAAGEDCRSQGMAFIPIAVESFGGWHQTAVSQVKKLAACLARQKGQEEQEAARHAFSRLATLIQKGNANIISNRTPTWTAASVDGQADGDG